MSAINKALSHIKYVIPREILQVVFINRLYKYNVNPISIDESILSQVIRPRVLVDCNLIGGQEAYINLDGVPQERTNDYTVVFRIPKTVTDGRSINSVLNITMTDPTRLSSYAMTNQCQATPLMLMGQAVMDALGPTPITSTAYVQLIAENTVMVRDTFILPANCYLRCILAMDEDMNHIQLRSYPVISKLIEYAVKSYIYHKYIIEMDVAELQGGHNIGRFKEVIDSYADAEENYQDYLTNTVQKVLYMNDSSSYSRLLKLVISNNR